MDLFGTSNKNNFRISKYNKWRIKNSEDSFCQTILIAKKIKLFGSIAYD